jgi:heme A synthase
MSHSIHTRAMTVWSGWLAAPLLLCQCGPAVTHIPDYTPIGDGMKFIGICLVLAVIVAALATLVSGDSAGDD